MTRDSSDGEEDPKLAAEDAMGLAELKVLFKRVKAPWLTREQLQALYLGQYTEVLEHFAGRATVTSAQMSDWLRYHDAGRQFWARLCQRSGLSVAPFDGSLYEIAHVFFRHDYDEYDNFGKHRLDALAGEDGERRERDRLPQSRAPRDMLEQNEYERNHEAVSHIDPAGRSCYRPATPLSSPKAKAFSRV